MKKRVMIVFLCIFLGIFFVGNVSATDYYNNVTITGTLDPDVTGTYTAMELLYNDLPSYQRGNDDYYLWYLGGASGWIISTQLGLVTGYRWKNSNSLIDGATYAPYVAGGATGTATATINISSGIFWSDGDSPPIHTPVTYYVRADGNATNKESATGPVTDISKTMNLTIFNNEEFYYGDTIYFSALGGEYNSSFYHNSYYNASLIIPSSGTNASNINYIGLSDGEGGYPIINLSSDISNTVGIMIESKDYINISNFRIRGSGGGKAFFFRSSSGLSGEGYTIKARNIEVLSNFGASSGDGDCFGSGNSLNDNNEAEFWNITASGCRESGNPTSSHQAFTLHEYAKAKIHGANFSDSNYWFLNTKDTQLEVDNLVATTPRIAGIAISVNNSITITNSTLSLGSTGGFIRGSSSVEGIVNISNSNITLNSPNGGIDTLRGTLNLIRNNIILNSSNWSCLLDAENSHLNLYNNILKIEGLNNTLYQINNGTSNFYNNVVYNSVVNGTFANQSAGNLTIKNNIFWNVKDILYNVSGTNNLSNNIYFNSSNEGGENYILSNPLFMSPGVDFNLQQLSPAIDAGTNVNLTTDYLGNPIYGTPDIGAYEYQPPYNISSDVINMSISDKIRIYGDGKYKYINSTTSSILANLSVSPTSNFNSTNYSQWIDINITSWTSTLMNWIESSDTLGNTINVTHNVCSLIAGNQYDTYYTKNGTRTLISRYTVDSNGCIEFNYTHGYSTVIFDMQKYTAPATTEEETPTSSGGGLPTYYPTESNLKEGYSKILGKNWKLKFNFKNETHEIKIDDIQNKSATITISSNPKTFNLSINQTKKIDLDDNGFYDISVLLKNITGNTYYRRAEVYIKSINEEIIKDKLNTTQEDNTTNQKENNKAKDTISENIKENKFIYGIIGIILVVTVITFLILKFKPKKKRK